MQGVYKLNLENFIDHRETALVGREHGESLLHTLKEKNIILQRIEAEFEKIEITVPHFIVSINKSYFLGFLETRIQELGPDAFREKYVFIADEFILRKINKNIDSASYNASQENILGLDSQNE